MDEIKKEAATISEEAAIVSGSYSALWLLDSAFPLAGLPYKVVEEICCYADAIKVNINFNNI